MTKSTKRMTFAASVAMLIGLTATQFGATAPESTLTIGAPAPQFSLQDQDGKSVSLSDYAGKTVVLEWMDLKCPFVARHYAAKTMVNLANEYKDKGVVWLAIDSTHDTANAANKAWAEAHQLSYPILNDSAGTVGHAYDAKTTPEMYVITKAGTLAYAGGIDNDPEGTKGASATNYVKAALDDVLADKPVATPKAKSYGCSVHYGK